MTEVTRDEKNLQIFEKWESDILYAGSDGPEPDRQRLKKAFVQSLNGVLRSTKIWKWVKLKSICGDT